MSSDSQGRESTGVDPTSEEIQETSELRARFVAAQARIDAIRRMARGEDPDASTRDAESGIHPSGAPREIEFINRNFTLPGDSLIRGYAGMPSYLRRAKELEDRLDRFWKEIGSAYLRMQEEVKGRYEFGRRWLAFVDTLDMTGIEQTIDDYNRYFPIEANLPMDPKLGNFTYRGKAFEPAVAPERSEVLRRFPAELAG